MSDEDKFMSLRSGELRTEMQDLSRLADSFGNKLATSMASAVVQGRKLSDVMRGLVLSLSSQALSAAIRPLGSLVGRMAQGLFSPAGLSSGKIQPFASGGIVNSPVLFPMRGGTGLMGEAGPEAILPLARGADGRLGVRTSASRPVNLTINIATPDVQGFQKSQAQVAAAISRALARGQRVS